MAQLTQELMIQYKKTFSVYSKDAKISTKDLGAVMRALGYNPTDAELQVRSIDKYLNITSF